VRETKFHSEKDPSRKRRIDQKDTSGLQIEKRDYKGKRREKEANGEREKRERVKVRKMSKEKKKRKGEKTRV
jgi:hypothetical protein